MHADVAPPATRWGIKVEKVAHFLMVAAHSLAQEACSVRPGLDVMPLGQGASRTGAFSSSHYHSTGLHPVKIVVVPAQSWRTKAKAGQAAHPGKRKEDAS